MIILVITRSNSFVSWGEHILHFLPNPTLLVTSAALVPFMQKDYWVRSIHVSLNLVLLRLFDWQAVTGVQIV
jgi:hypothetical protein